VRCKEKDKKEELFDNALLDILKTHELSIDDIERNSNPKMSFELLPLQSNEYSGAPLKIR
jgi:hypothetical protein